MDDKPYDQIVCCRIFSGKACNPVDYMMRRKGDRILRSGERRLWYAGTDSNRQRVLAIRSLSTSFNRREVTSTSGAGIRWRWNRYLAGGGVELVCSLMEVCVMLHTSCDGDILFVARSACFHSLFRVVRTRRSGRPSGSSMIECTVRLIRPCQGFHGPRSGKNIRLPFLSCHLFALPIILAMAILACVPVTCSNLRRANTSQRLSPVELSARVFLHLSTILD
jgi:hypothetical protein